MTFETSLRDEQSRQKKNWGLKLKINISLERSEHVDNLGKFVEKFEIITIELTCLSKIKHGLKYQISLADIQYPSIDNKCDQQ